MKRPDQIEAIGPREYLHKGQKMKSPNELLVDHIWIRVDKRVSKGYWKSKEEM